MASSSLRFSPVTSIHDIDQDLWQSLNPTRYPFLDHRFLVALEDTQCIGGNSGWHPRYFIRSDQRAILPCFLKEHSYGEYVFDWSWAEAYQRHGLGYYPKLLCAAPFTPATGPRLLMAHSPTQQDWGAVLAVLNDTTQTEHLSGWHANFLTRADHQHIIDLPQGTHDQLVVSQRANCQFHWFNRNYRDFEHYLDFFTSRKRKSVRKERKRLQEADIHVQRLTGTCITEADIQFFYQCYQLTYLKRRSQGYLNEDFFQQLRRTMSDQMMLVIARHDDQPLAAALYFFDQTTLYGRYWGCMNKLDALHFEACYYQGIEFAIEQGLQKFDPGTQGEHKISRGFEPVLTHSWHWLAHPAFNDAVADFVQQERQQIIGYQKEAATLLPFKENAFITAADECPSTSTQSPVQPPATPSEEIPKP